MADRAVLGVADGDERAAQIAAAVGVVIEAGRLAAARYWVPATSGNFSARVDASTIAITRSGTDKGALSPADILLVDLRAPDPTASAEAPLHYALYRDDPALGAVFHIHSPSVTVLSRAVDPGSILLKGWELQKALAGVSSHEAVVELPILANDQDTVRLAEAGQRSFTGQKGALRAPGYAIAGHGLYAWGRDAKEAWRHTEALETLLSYELFRRLLTQERQKA